MSRQKKVRREVKRCPVCRQGELRYSKFRKHYRCSNAACNHRELAPNIHQEVDQVQKERWG